MVCLEREAAQQPGNRETKKMCVFLRIWLKPKKPNIWYMDMESGNKGSPFEITTEN